MIKRDVLAGGKGVVVTTDREEARAFIEESIQSMGISYSNGSYLARSEYVGRHGSFGLCLLTSKPRSQRAYDGDRGPNTGGMGATAQRLW